MRSKFKLALALAATALLSAAATIAPATSTQARVGVPTPEEWACIKEHRPACTAQCTAQGNGPGTPGFMLCREACAYAACNVEFP